MVADENRGTRFEVLLSLDYETDVDHSTSEEVEAARDDIEYVEPAASEAHTDRTYHAPYGAHSEGRQVEANANIVACDGTTVRERLEGEDGERDVDERPDDACQE